MKDRILIVAKDESFRMRLADMLESTGDYLAVSAGTFEEAISEILLADFALVVTETQLPDLSGMDLLSIVGGLRPGINVLLIDDGLSAKSAVAAMRLGASDYLHKPVNMHFLLMRIEQQIATRRIRRTLTLEMPAVQVDPDMKPQSEGRPLPVEASLPTPPPKPRGIAPLLDREQFTLIHQELERLLEHIRAHFVGLLDAEGNLAGSAGNIEASDLALLTQALSVDRNATTTLASLLDENQFHSTYLEGERNGVYILQLDKPYLMSLVVICATHVKPGMVWLYSKRSADFVTMVLKRTPQSPEAAAVSL